MVSITPMQPSTPSARHYLSPSQCNIHRVRIYTVNIPLPCLFRTRLPHISWTHRDYQLFFIIITKSFCCKEMHSSKSRPKSESMPSRLHYVYIRAASMELRNRASKINYDLVHKWKFEMARTAKRWNLAREWFTAYDIFTARKRSLGQGNIFTPVCHSVHREEYWAGTPPDQVHPPGPGTPQDQVHPLGLGTSPRTRYTPGQGTPPGPGTPPD